jgi:hypothetical protein
MSQKLCAKTYKLRPALLGLSLLGALVLVAVGIGNTSCEDKGIGRPCDIWTDAAPSQGVFNSEALECPSRICLKPVDESNNPPDPATGPYCSASCSQDSDCNDGQTRDTTVSTDRRCKSGFTCGIPFVKGRLCCQKLCLCRDFLGTSSPQTPPGCITDEDKRTCNTVSQ